MINDHDVKNNIKSLKIKIFKKGKEYYFHVTQNGARVDECTHWRYCELYLQYNWRIILSICSIIGIISSIIATVFTILSYFK
jgi:hypothetical protein